MTIESYPVAIAKGAMVAAYRIQESHQILENSIQYWGLNCLLSHNVFIEELYQNNWVKREHNQNLTIINDQFNDYYQILDQIGEQFNALCYKHLEGLSRLLRFNNTLYWIRAYPKGQALSTWVSENQPINNYAQLAQLFTPIFDDLHLHHRLKRQWFNIDADQIWMSDNGKGILIAPTMEICLARAGEWSSTKDLYQLLGAMYFAMTGKRVPSELEREQAHRQGQPNPFKPLVPRHFPHYPKSFIRTLNRWLAVPDMAPCTALQLKQQLFSEQTQWGWNWLRNTISVGLGLTLAVVTPTPATQQGLHHQTKPNVIQAPSSTPTPTTPATVAAPKVSPPKITTTPTAQLPESNNKACILGLKHYCSQP